MAFFDALVITYSYPVTGTVAVTRTIKGPLGRAGRVLEVSASATVDFVGTTTPTTVLVKTLSAVPTQINYATVTFGTAATPLTTFFGQVASAGSAAPSDTVAGIKVSHELPKDTSFRIMTVAGTGGTPAGNGEVNVTIAWY